MALTDQPSTSGQPQRSALRAILPYTSVAVVIAAIYVAWTLYSRHEENQRAVAEAQQKQAEAAKQSYDAATQHGELTFVTFEASAGVLKRGQTTDLCYGIVNAKSVKIDPPVEQIKPSYRHCMEIAPKKTTTYTITADDGAGHSKSLSLSVKVQ